MSLLDRAVAGAVPRLPRGLVGAVARRYIAGESLSEAVAKSAALNRLGMSVTLDVLGEHVTHVSQTEPTVGLYLDVLRHLESDGVDGNISVKPTHLGLDLEPVRCLENVRALVDAASAVGRFVRIDMEDSSTTDATLDLYRALRDEGRDNVGVVLQSYLFRSEHDARELAKLGTNVRVCKGIYREPASVAWHDREEVRRSYLRVVDVLLSHGCHVGIATHDPALVEGAYRLLESAGTKGGYEFQMLLGVAERLRDSIVAAGHPMRIYVPFGREWYAYSIRRLRENPQIAGHVFRAMVGIGG